MSLGLTPHDILRATTEPPDIRYLEKPDRWGRIRNALFPTERFIGVGSRGDRYNVRIHKKTGRQEITPLTKPTLTSPWPFGETYEIIPIPQNVYQLMAMKKLSPTYTCVVNNIKRIVFWKYPELEPAFKYKCEKCGKEFDEDPKTKDKPDTDMRQEPAKGPGGHTPDGTGPYGQGQGPGQGRADGSGMTTPPPPFPPPQEEEEKLIEEEPTCDEEGCDGKLVEPDKEQKEKYEKFIEEVNLFRRSLYEELEMFEDALNIVDDAYLIFAFSYVTAPDGSAAHRELRELVYGPPETLRMVRDKRGRALEVKEFSKDNNPPQGWWTCRSHRFRSTDVANLHRKSGLCPVCGCELQPVHWVSLKYGQSEILPEIGYLDGEILHVSKYAPTEFYGFSPIATSWVLGKTDLNMDETRSEIFAHRRPPKGVLVFNTRNEDSGMSQWKAEMIHMAKNPLHMPTLFMDTEGRGQPVVYQNITPDLSELNIIEHKRDIRNEIAKVFGVPPAMMGDMKTTGGLNQESMQLTMEMIEVAEFGHKPYHRKVFPKIEKALEITDWKLKFPRSIEADKNMEAARRGMNMDVAQKALALGATVRIIGEKDAEIEIREPPEGLKPKKEVTPFGMPGMGQQPPMGGGPPKPGGAGGQFRPKPGGQPPGAQIKPPGQSIPMPGGAKA